MHKRMTARHAYRVVSLYAFLLALLFGAILAFGPATGIITGIALLGCFICSSLMFWLFFASLSADPHKELAGIAISILLDSLMR